MPRGPDPLRDSGGGLREMAATRSEHDTTAERLLRQVFAVASDQAAQFASGAAGGTAGPLATDEVEPTDAELAELSAEEEDALYGKGAGFYGGADGTEDAFQSYLHDIRGLSLLSHEEEIILAKRGQAGDGRA